MYRKTAQATAIMATLFFLGDAVAEAQLGRLRDVGRAIVGIQRSANAQCTAVIGGPFYVDGVLTRLGIKVFTGNEFNPGVLTQFDRSDTRAATSEVYPGAVLIHKVYNETKLGGLHLLTVGNANADGWEAKSKVRKAATCGVAHRIRGNQFHHLDFFERHSDLIASAVMAGNAWLSKDYFAGRKGDARVVRDIVRLVEETLSLVIGEKNLVQITAEHIAEQEAVNPTYRAPPGCDLSELRKLASSLEEFTIDHANRADRSQHAALIAQASLVSNMARECSP